MTSAPLVQNQLTTCELEAYQLAGEGFVYLYPLMLMDATRKQCVNLPAGKRPGAGPANQFSHMRAYPEADFRLVVRPNFDTLYSIAWLDLSSGPQVITVPNSNGRYYLLPMLDMWTDVFAVPGSRTSGTEAQELLLTPPGWSGKIRAGMKHIPAPTSWVWIIGRVRTDGPSDYDAVHKFQDGLQIKPYADGSTTGGAVKSDGEVDFDTPPMDQVDTMSAAEFFARGNELMAQFVPHITDWSALSRLARIGIIPGETFDLNKFNPACQKAISKALADGHELLKANVRTVGSIVNGWLMNTDSVGVYGNAYLKRAILALVGLGANPPEDAIYPMNVCDQDGEPIHGKNNYVLHFEEKEIPPADAFWSVTMYDAKGFQSANSLNRFAISSWMPLKRNSDGSLDLYIQNGNPGKEKESNWLPAPNDFLGITMRLYSPRIEALTGQWKPPAIKKL